MSTPTPTLFDLALRDVLTARRSDLTQQRLQELFTYDPATGVFRRRITRGGEAAGKAAGSIVTGGYLRICVDRNDYVAHRLAWLYVHGRWPTHGIDHINGDPKDNRMSNLRDVPQETNLQNLRAARNTSATGLLGASPYRGRYRATITASGRQTTIGYFDTASEAHAAYVAAKRQLHIGGTI